MNKACALIRLSRLYVENANAISGDLTWGFPAPSAFLGFAHVLERRLNSIKLGGVGIVCHSFDPQVAYPDGPFRPGRFRLSCYPYIAGWKKFKNERSAILEEGKAHLEVSLLIEVHTELREEECQDLDQRMKSIVPTLRLAGGSIRGDPNIQTRVWPEWEEDQRKDFRKIRYHLLPGFVLVQSQGFLDPNTTFMSMESAEASTLGIFLDRFALYWDPPDEKARRSEWQVRSKPGWLVPLPVGYAALSPLCQPGSVAHARDPTVPFRFVESLYTVGQWLSPHRLTSLEQMLWYSEADLEKGLYLCRNGYYQSAKETQDVEY